MSVYKLSFHETLKLIYLLSIKQIIYKIIYILKFIKNLQIIIH